MEGIVEHALNDNSLVLKLYVPDWWTRKKEKEERRNKKKNKEK